MRRLLLLVAASIALAACTIGSPSAPPTPGPSPSPSVSATPVSLHVANGTTLTVSLFVNGQLVAEFPTHGPGSSIDLTSLPPLPWTVEARSPSGRVLTSMTVDAGSLGPIVTTGGGLRYRIPVGRVDLSCGRLTIWAGDVPVSGPATASPADRSDCAP